MTREKEEAERLDLMEKEKRKIKGCLDAVTELLVTFEDEQVTICNDR